MPAEIFETDGQPGRASVRLGKRLGGPKILANNFAHDPISIGATRPHVTRRGYKAEVAQTVLDGAHAGVWRRAEPGSALDRLHQSLWERDIARQRRHASR